MKLINSGFKCVLLFFVFLIIINMILGFLFIMEGLKGLNLNVVIVCIIGVYNIGIVVRIIVYGDVDVMLVGGVEVFIILLGMVGFVVVCVLLFCNDNL